MKIALTLQVNKFVSLLMASIIIANYKSEHIKDVLIAALCISTRFHSISLEIALQTAWFCVWGKFVQNMPIFKTFVERQPEKTAVISRPHGTTGFPAKWHSRNELRNFILMMCLYPGLGIRSASDWLRHDHWDKLPRFAVVVQMSFRGETSGGDAKCQPFS